MICAGCSVRLPSPPEYDAAGSGKSGDDAAFGDGGQISRDGATADPGADGPPWWQTPDWSSDAWRGWDYRADAPRPSTDVPEPDSVLPPPAWLCTVQQQEIPPDLIGPGLNTGSFTLFSQSLNMADQADTFLFPNTYKCGWEQSNPQWHDRAYVLLLDQVSEMRAELFCNGDCYLYTYFQGCLYQHQQGCWTASEQHLSVSTDLLPGYHVMVVEFLPTANMNVQDFRFDIHVAINKTNGQDPCLVEDTTAYTGMESICLPLAADGTLQTTVDGVLAWDDEDDFYLPCSAFGTKVDPLGGMPDVVHAFTADRPDAFPAEIEVQLDIGSLPGAELGFMLALSTAPCGASEAILDCASGPGPLLQLAPATLFPGETLYAIVDSLSGADFYPGMSVPYSLTWKMAGNCK